jgi:uncharacterized protein
VDVRERRLAAESSVAEEAITHASRKIHGDVEMQIVVSDPGGPRENL